MSKQNGRILVGNLDESAKRARDFLMNKWPVNDVLDWAIAFSLWPPHFTTSCCGCEFGAVAGPRFDPERYGFLPFVSARQTNILVIEGTMTRKMARAARIVWEQMPEPKFAMVMGACAMDGGIFWNSYNIVLAEEIGIPVHVYIPGCPPRPEAIARGILELQRKIRESGAFNIALSETKFEQKPVDFYKLK